MVGIHSQEIPLGRWDFRSKSSKDSCSQEGWCRGYMFSLEVTEELEAWPEQKDHNRQWVIFLSYIILFVLIFLFNIGSNSFFKGGYVSQVNIKEAFRLSRYDWMCKALEVFISVMAEDIKLRNEEDNVDSSSISVLHVSESQYVSSKCYKRTTSKQHHSISSRTNILSHASQEIAIHLGY